MSRIVSLYANAYRGLSPEAWWLSVVMLINRAGSMVLPFMTLYLTQSKGYSLGKAGIVISLFGMGAICGSILGGKLTDKFGFHRVQIASLAGGGIMFFVLGQVSGYPTICAVSFLLSLVNESFRPANAAAIAHYSKEENRTRSYSLNRLAINLGWAAGSSLGGFLAAHNYTLLFWVDGATNIGAAILLSLVLAPGKIRQTETEVVKPVLPSVSAYKDKPYIAFIVLTMLFGYCFFQLFSTLPVFYKESLRMSEFQIGAIMAVNGILIALFEMVIVHRLEGKRPVLQYIFWGTALVGLSFIVFNVFSGGVWLAVLAMLIITIGEILAMPFMNTFWIARSGAQSRGQYAGLFTLAWSVAQVLGPSTGAQIADR